MDLETTGVPTEEDRHAVCEVGWCDLTPVGGGDVIVGEPRGMVTDPRRPMPPEGRAVHHIGDADIAAGHPITDAFLLLNEGPPDIFCAHRADFERAFFGGGDARWVCSYKVSLRLWPDSPSHSLQVLRYWLCLDLEHELAMPPHRAAPDAYVCAVLMARILEDGRVSIDDMVRWSSGPALLPRINFGKHKGSRWEDVPADYLHWVVDKSDLDRDVKANAKHHLKQRETA